MPNKGWDFSGSAADSLAPQRADMTSVSLSTPWSRAIGLRVPVVSAPMGGVAGGRLAAAVTAAGGLGMVGMGSAGSASSLHTELPYVSGAFGIGLVDWVIRKEHGLFDAALAAQPVLISVSFGTDLSWVRRVHDAGIAAATQVYSSDEARRAEDAGIDVVIARGSEGGGHGEATIGTLPLLAAVLDVVSVPVLAAGGIASPRSLAAVLAAGAGGAWLGTCLSASAEALTSDAGRRALVAARATDTVSTRVFDIARRRPWAQRFPSRVLYNDFVARWSGREDALADDPDAATELSAAIAADDPRTVPVLAGQGVGMVTDVEPAGHVIDRLCTGARELLAGWGQTACT
jgi:nitronate monooxygenase